MAMVDYAYISSVFTNAVAVYLPVPELTPVIATTFFILSPPSLL